MKTVDQYVSTFNTGAASWGLHSKGFPEGFSRKNLKSENGRIILPSPEEGKKIGFCGSDCVGDGRFWAEGYESDGKEWTRSIRTTRREVWNEWKQKPLP